MTSKKPLQKKKEPFEKLHDSVIHFRDLAETNLIGVAFSDKNGTVTWINNEMLRMMGFVRADFVAGRINWEACLAPDCRPDTGTWTERLVTQDVLSTREWSFIRPDGGRTPFMGAAAGIRSDQACCVIIGQDLSPVREAENSRWKNDQRLRMASDYLNIGIFEWNLTRNMAFWENEQMYRIFGRNREQGPLTYSEFVDLAVHVPDREAFVRAFTRAKKPGQLFDHSCRIQRQDGKDPHWVEINGKFYQNSADASLCLIGLATDISERKQYELDMIQINEVMEQRALERKERIQKQADRLRVLANRLGRVERKERTRLAGILHDHIQPLVVGARMQLWEILRKNDIDDVHQTARKIEGVLDETLKELRSLTVDMSPSAILNDSLMDGLQWLVTYMEKKFNFVVEFVLENEIDAISEDTTFLLFECVKELLFNAVKHSGENHARLTLDRTDEQNIHITVSDNGKGFDLNQMTAGQEKMVCLGLFSIEERLNDIGGRLLIQTEPGQGTTMTLTAPAGKITTPASSAMNRRESDRKTSSYPSGNRVGILIVDDHKLLREGLSGLLEMETDFEVVGEAADADMAVDQADRLRPDVVIMDVNLGDTNGMDATRRILSRHPEIKVIGLSMHSEKKIRDAMYDAGAAAFLNKSIPSDELIDRVRECIAGE